MEPSTQQTTDTAAAAAPAKDYAVGGMEKMSAQEIADFFADTYHPSIRQLRNIVVALLLKIAELEG